MFSKILSVLAVLPLASALAGVPDLTGSLEYLGNPAASRWPTSSKSRHVQDLQPHRGKIYTSGGEWGNNTGPCPCFAVDPYSGAYVNEFDAGTDAIYEFKEFSDGRLYTSAVDPHENAANIGHTFRRGATGTWYAYRNCHGGNLSDLGSSGYPIHNWDMVEYGDKVFVCGYGISGSTNRCETKMFNATPTLTSSSRKVAAASWTDSSGGKYNAPYGYSLYRRFCAFLPFDDDLFCVTTQPTLKNDRQTWNEWEEWRWDASQKRFNCQTNTWTYVAPGVTDSMMDIFSYSDGLETLQLWHPTKFKNRVLYIVGGHNYNITPIAAYSAVNENHTIKATRLDLGATSVKPFDIYATADAVYLVAAQAGTTTSTVTNSVWKSTDGVAFTPLFTFTSTRQASALCYYDGAFYFGMGANDYTKTCWPKVTGTDVSGRIYRVRLPQEEKPSVVATTDAIATTEGAKGAKAGFCLAVRPATNVTLQVSATHPAIVVSPTQLTFTSADWSTAQEVTVDVAEDDDSLADIRGSVVCSAADASFFSGYVSVVATNNDFRAVETAPEGLVDLTSPSGTFEATSGAVTMLPFNDETNLNQTTNRVCIQKTDFSITYDFGTATHVDAYGIYNLACNTQTTRPPKVWTFAGSDDKTAWTQLDQRRYETNWTSGEYRYYSFANAKKYRYYRIAFTANNGDSYTQFAHLEYYSVKPPTTSVNYWIAAEGSDGLASTAGNWSAGVPTAASDIVISPTNSSVTLVWDAAAPQTINSYRQYGLTNEVRTTFSSEFPVLTVTGDMIVADGVLTHPRGAANVSANVSRLKLSVGGDFLLGTNATVNLKGKGLAGGQKPTGSTAGSHAASCDGYAKVYGNVYRPEHPGSGSNGSNMWGGGALWLEVAGAATIDGTITVRPEEKDNIKQPAAGSVYVKAASCAGSGHILADYAATSYYNGGAGSGGRVAIELTEAATLGLAESHISVHGINAGGANGGGGTIFVKTADATMPNGTLILDDTRAKSYGARWHKPTAVTAIPSGETWTFDAIKIRNYGVLAVPAGTKLVLPKGVASVTASSQRLGGILYQGGEIDFGEGPYEFAQPWIFQANKPYTFNGNVTVKAGGALGCLQFMGSNDLSDFTKCDVVVNGDLTVEKGGYIWAESAGPDLNIDRTTSAYHGGQTGVLTYAAVYDSILDPSLPGWGMATGDRATSQPGGGVLKLTVNGALTVDGTVTAYANKNSNNSEGAGGTINIRAKTLAGEGSIMADSYKFTSQQYAGGGGRIAVRLSEQAVGTDGIFTRITAKGATVVTSGGYKPNHSSSAGTVYLQGKDDAEGAGTIRVCNDGNAQSVDPYTPFPSKGNGAEAVDALKNASLFVGSCAKVKLFEAVEVQALAFDATGRLDLNGQTLTVASATVNGETLAAGTYRADASRTWLVDSSTEAVGRLVVVGGTAPGLDPEADAPIVSGSSVGVVTSGGGTAGESVFSVSIGNVKAGLYYTTFIAENLGDTFKASDGSVRATADGGLAFELPTGGKASLFVKVVVSSAPYSAGAELK